jgi:hypothetical protein
MSAKQTIPFIVNFYVLSPRGLNRNKHAKIIPGDIQINKSGHITGILTSLKIYSKRL